MFTTCQKLRFTNPHWYGFSEAPYTGMRGHALRPDIAQWVEQQTHNLWVAGSTPAVNKPLTRLFSL
jgi:hypothetical protein